jgi:hypothetical protein
LKDQDCLEFVPASLNWDRLFVLATEHRVLPVVCTSLLSSDLLSPEIRTEANAKLANHQRRVLRFSAVLSQILQKFEENEIPVLPFKGPALSQLLYGDPAMREFGDLDLLVHPQHVTRARTALGELGYEPKLQLSPLCEREYLRTGYELVFGTEKEKNLMELHWQVLPRFYSVPFRTEAIFERSAETIFEGRTARVPSKEDLLLMLCVHAAKHEWWQLGMVRDIATLARFELDWNWIEGEACCLGVMRIVLTSLLLAGKLVGCDIPANFNSSPLLPSCEALATEMENKLIFRGHLNPESPAYFLFMMRLRERWRDRVRFIWRLATTPSIEEWETVAFPQPLFALYYLVRIGRLAKRFAKLFLNAIGLRSFLSESPRPDASSSGLCIE